MSLGAAAPALVQCRTRGQMGRRATRSDVDRDDQQSRRIDRILIKHTRLRTGGTLARSGSKNHSRAGISVYHVVVAMSFYSLAPVERRALRPPAPTRIRP